MTLEVHPLTPGRWGDFVELFERRGPRGGHQNAPAYGCWCMYWRDRTVGHGEPKKRAMHRSSSAAKSPAWSPTTTERRWAGSRSRHGRRTTRCFGRRSTGREEDEEGIWSIVCFTVDKMSWARRTGGAACGVVGHAFTCGAKAIEAYPHLGSRRLHGTHRALRAHGFEPVRGARAGRREARTCVARSWALLPSRSSLSGQCLQSRLSRGQVLQSRKPYRMLQCERVPIRSRNAVSTTTDPPGSLAPPGAVQFGHISV